MVIMMRKYVVQTVLLSLGLLLAGCNSSETTTKGLNETQKTKENQEETKVEDDTKKVSLKNLKISDTYIKGKETILIYMVGSNLESEEGLASEDIKEMLDCNFPENNLDVYLCVGGTKKWWLEDIPSDTCGVYRIADGKQEPVAVLENKNMAESSTLTEFINLVYEKTHKQTQYYSMIMWDHGGGTILGFGADENYQYDTLTTVEMDQGLKNTKLMKEGRKLEWIGFDACLMGTLEVAEMLSDYSKYLIASEEVEGGHGWKYSVLDTISKNGHLDGLQAGRDLVDSYENYCKSLGAAAPDYTMSCMDLSKVGDTISCLEKLAEAAGEEIKKNGYSKIARRRDNSKSFGKISNKDFYDMVDLYDLSLQLLDLYPQYVKDLWHELDDFIVYAKSNVERANGVAVYFPYSNKEYVSQWMNVYEDIEFSEGYINFLKDFTNMLTGKKFAEWKIAGTAPQKEAQESGTYFMQLTEEQCDNYGHAKYTIWQQDGDTSVCWLQSGEVTLSDDGKLKATLEKKKFYLKDNKGNRYDCTAIETEHTEDYEKYVIPIAVWEAENPVMTIYWIHVRLLKDRKSCSVVGIYKEMNSDSMVLPNKNTMELQIGDSVCPFLFARDISYQQDGTIETFEKWKITSGLGKGFTYQGTLDIVYEDMELKENVCCLFSITDTQSNTYFSNPLYFTGKDG